MRQEIGEYLELPGKVVMLEPISKGKALEEVHGLLDKFENSSIKNLGEIPEGEEKDRLRTLFRVLGLDVRF
jgi:hypothetical protein